MSSKTWKKKESDLARIFATKRRPLGQNNSSFHGDDAQHPVLYLECKQGTQCNKMLDTLINDTVTKAAKAGKVPVLGLHRKGDTKGFYLIIRSSDLPRVLQEYLEGRGWAVNYSPADPDTTPFDLSPQKAADVKKPKSPLPGSRVQKRV